MGTVKVDVVVVGGGAMGSAAAWQLARRGLDTILLERYAPGHHNGASHGASRMYRNNFADPVYLSLAREAERLYRELEELTGATLLEITGGVDHGRRTSLVELADDLASAGVDAAWMSPEEASERWPGLRFDTRVLFHPGNGRVNADRTVESLQESARAFGASIRHESPVVSIRVREEDLVEVRTETDIYLCKRAVVAVNSWAQKVLGTLVPLPKLVITQEQPAHFPSSIPAERWPSFGHLFPRGTEEARVFHGGIYGLATPGEGIKVGFHGVGPVVDPDNRSFQPDPLLMDELCEYVRRWVPGADPDRPTPISCTYTTTEDDHFVLDRKGPLVVATGFSGKGFKFVPAIGRVLADLATGDERADPRFWFERSVVLDK